MSIDMKRCTEYNEKLSKAKKKCSELNSELEFSTRELDRLCRELSAELGIKITPDNIQEVYEQEQKKIEKTLAIGEEILDRIERGEVSGGKIATDEEISSLQYGGVGSTDTVSVPVPVSVEESTDDNVSPSIGAELGGLFNNISSNDTESKDDTDDIFGNLLGKL